MKFHSLNPYAAGIREVFNQRLVYLFIALGGMLLIFTGVVLAPFFKLKLYDGCVRDEHLMMNKALFNAHI